MIQLVGKLHQAGRIPNLHHVCGVFGCVHQNDSAFHAILGNQHHVNNPLVYFSLGYISITLVLVAAVQSVISLKIAGRILDKLRSINARHPRHGLFLPKGIKVQF